ncbi:hypothetical protein D1816_16040 [Aquimarina sp. AD10]|uniref:DUF6168 family protein n=1 Tax=Aquimarina sp. AD10 TaxID=1714849 RepID=UPI000E52D417|nr:DUF6168 family protein [Aquimarina sp. AD10]AXT61801.1 hypothetical protein D1816_16040 [Aquimarina sp. AD10]RKN02599.1 hypothetical protein D7033_00165 [Aquimarina sp. AD10]
MNNVFDSKTLQSLSRFLILFIGILVVGYFIHSQTIQYFSFHSNTYILDLSYLFNGAFTVVLFLIIIVFRKKFKDQIGFIFMAGSLIKLGIFAAITKMGGVEIDKTIFLDFFIPYVISVVLEVYYISKILKNTQYADNQQIK